MTGFRIRRERIGTVLVDVIRGLSLQRQTGFRAVVRRLLNKYVESCVTGHALLEPQQSFRDSLCKCWEC